MTEKSRSSLAMQNSTIGLLSRIVIIVLQFFARSIFLEYLGVELMGVSSTFTSALSTLSLAELGFQSAVVYTLYKPLANHDEAQINEVITVLRVIYQSIGLMFIVTGVICIPLLPAILKDVEITGYIRVIFLIQVSNSSATYLLAYKRSLLYADGKAYVSTLVDTVVNVVIEILKIVLVITTKNYIIYVSLTTIQTILSNVIIHMICGKLYPCLKKTRFNKEIFKGIWDKVKNVFAAKLAYYVYNSTDNLVISSLISTVAVGFTSNYVTVVASLKSLATSIIDPIAPIIGNLIASDHDEGHQENVLKICTFIRFVIAIVIIVPLMVLIQDFIEAWIGKQYILSYTIILLYAIDMYIHIVHSALCDFISGSGLFREERNVEIAGAICNIVVSVVLAATLRNISVEMGVIGVLIGTIISQTVFWVYRSVIVYRHCFSTLSMGLVKYWLRNAGYILFTVGVTLLMHFVYSLLGIQSFIIRFIVTGIVCESVIFILLFALYGHTMEFNYLWSIGQKMLTKVIRRER